MGTRHAFHRLMADAGKTHGWTLIAEQEKKVNGKTIRPDGTFKDEMNLVRGYWEAKDTADNLDAEIEKKRKAGYPLNNIIFEDTPDRRPLSARPAHPDGRHEGPGQARRADQRSSSATSSRRSRSSSTRSTSSRSASPTWPRAWQKKIEQAHRTNPAFKQAFADFFELCQHEPQPEHLAGRRR